MSAEAVVDAGVEPITARAIVARLRWKEGLGLKEHFDGVEPPTTAPPWMPCKGRSSEADEGGRRSHAVAASLRGSGRTPWLHVAAISCTPAPSS